MVRVQIFYHNCDADGWSSAAIIHYALENNLLQLPEFPEGEKVDIHLQPWNYGYKLRTEKIYKGDVVFILDIHLPREEVITLHKITGQKIYYFDHHESVFEEMSEIKELFADGSVFDDSHAACLHSFNFVTSHFRRNVKKQEKERFERLRKIYEMFEMYDVHTFDTLPIISAQDVINLNYYLFSIESDPSTIQGASLWQEIFEKAGDEDEFVNYISEICNVGLVIYKSMQKMHLEDLKVYSFEAEFEGLRMLCVNKYPGEGSMYFREWPTKGYDVLCMFYFSGKTNLWSFSLFAEDSATDVDLLPIWKKYNKIRSGGHKRAGGFKARAFQWDPETKKLTVTME